MQLVETDHHRIDEWAIFKHSEIYIEIIIASVSYITVSFSDSFVKMTEDMIPGRGNDGFLKDECDHLLRMKNDCPGCKSPLSSMRFQRESDNHARGARTVRGIDVMGGKSRNMSISHRKSEEGWSQTGCSA